MEKVIYRFGPFVLSPAEQELRQNEVSIKLEARDFDLLVLLVQNAPLLVKKEVLLEKLWKDVIVEEGNLANSICILRKALGCNSKAPIYIQTIPKKGYRFIAEVTIDKEQLVQAETERQESTPVTVREMEKSTSPFDALIYALPEEGGAAIFLNFTRMASQRMSGEYPDAFMNYIHNDYPGFSMALDYYGRTSASLELEMALNMAFYWDERGLWAEGRERLRHALLRQGEGSSELKARALAWFGFMSFNVDDYQVAKKALSEAVSMAKQFEDYYSITLSLHALACVAEAEGQYGKAIELYQESLVARERAEPDGVSRLGLKNTYLGLGNVARELGDNTGAEKYYQTGLLKREQADDRRGIASSYIRLSVVAVAQGDPVRARLYLDKSRETVYGTPGKNSIALTQFNLGLVEAASGQYKAALAAFQCALELRRDISEKRGVARAMEAIGKIYALTNNDREAARMMGGAAALRSLAGAHWSPAEQIRHGRLAEEVHKKFPREFEEAEKRVIEEIMLA